MSEVVAEQRAVARLLLAELGAGGFALAGSGAMREHGLGSRPTEDVDLFTVITNRHRFAAAVEQATARLRTGGYTVTVVRRAPQFARLEVTAPGGIVTEVDLGVDWRAGDPVHLELGPVLSLADAVAAKVGALYSRGEARDFLDVDQIRQSGRFSDTQLMHLLAERDPGFDQQLFAEQLARVTHLDPRQVQPYGTTAEELAHIKHRLSTWARHLSESLP